VTGDDAARKAARALLRRIRTELRADGGFRPAAFKSTPELQFAEDDVTGGVARVQALLDEMARRDAAKPKDARRRRPGNFGRPPGYHSHGHPLLRSALAFVLSGFVGLAAATPKVLIRTVGDYRVIEANGLPTTPPGASRAATTRTRSPRRTTSSASRSGRRSRRAPRRRASPGLGSRLNGVPFEPGTQEYWKDDRASGWCHEAIGGESNSGIDQSSAHVQPNGAYRYHGVAESACSRCLATRARTC
jgi:hypothetical protein